MAQSYFIGVDVGTGSVRAGLFGKNGEIVRTASCPIKTWNEYKDFYEQSSDDVWKACCAVVKEVAESVDSQLIKGLGFDATCSLVCIGADDKPLSVSKSGNDEQNIILWMDHRAKSQAEFINNCKPNFLKYVGGKVSVEMETPKLLWIKENLNRTWREAKYYFDLADFLTWKATGDDSRSLCTVVCKWGYLAGVDEFGGWNRDDFTLIQLSELLDDDAFKIGKKIRLPGEKCGDGLTSSAAKQLGLLPGTSVGSGLIDAHAGGLGLLTSSALNLDPSFESKIGLICGTSTCLMVVNQHSKLVPGLWGPYFSAMVPNMYLIEAGQSVTGKLLDFVIDNHPASESLKRRLNGKKHIHEHLNDRLVEMAFLRGLKSYARLTSKLHIWPDFHGNRSPLADPFLLGMICGLSLDADEDDLVVKYLATIQALAYGTRHIVDRLRTHGCDKLSSALICGGLSKNKLFVQIQADVLGLPVVLPNTPEPVLLGAAILGAVASEHWTSIEEALRSIKTSSVVFYPSEVDREYHLKKYQVFLKMVNDQRSYDLIMRSEAES